MLQGRNSVQQRTGYCTLHPLCGTLPRSVAWNQMLMARSMTACSTQSWRTCAAPDSQHQDPTVAHTGSYRKPQAHKHCMACRHNMAHGVRHARGVASPLQQNELWGWPSGSHLYVHPAVAAEFQVPRLQFVRGRLNPTGNYSDVDTPQQSLPASHSHLRSTCRPGAALYRALPLLSTVLRGRQCPRWVG